MNTRALVAFVSISGLQAAAAFAQGPPPLGEEFQVNTYTTDDQGSPAVVADAGGNLFVVWHSDGQDGSGYGVFGQRYDANGSPVGEEFQVNSSTAYTQLDPVVGGDAAGDMIVAWEADDGYFTGVFGQRYDANGIPGGEEFQVNTYTTLSQWQPTVAADALGNFVVVWASDGQDGSYRGIWGQRYDATGNAMGEEFLVNTYTTGFQSYPAVAAGPSGGFVVVWESGQDGAIDGIFGQRYEPSGKAVGREFRVNTFTQGSQSMPAVAGDASGDFVVVWQSSGQDGYGNGVFGQRYDAFGTPLGEEFQVNTYTAGDQRHPQVARQANGGFVVVWESQDASDYGLFGQRYDAAGEPVGGEFQINTYAEGAQVRPSAAVDAAGRFVVVWRSRAQDGSGWGIFGQRFWGSFLFADGFESGDTAAWDETVP